MSSANGISYSLAKCPTIISMSPFPKTPFPPPNLVSANPKIRNTNANLAPPQALWGVDFNLYCASAGIRRVHMHQGTNYHYAAWQPISTPNATIGTKPPYYGNIAVASMLGDLTKANVTITYIPLSSELESAYAAYVDGELARVAIINLAEYNYTDSSGAARTTKPRPRVTYNISVPSIYGGQSVGVQRLMANGSDALSGITWDGYSYNWELDEGRPVLLRNVTRGETVKIGPGGQLQVVLPFSSVAIVDLS
jgi:hypothetical protein